MSRQGTLRNLTHFINMMEQHGTMTISCNDYFIEMLKDARSMIGEEPVKAEMHNKYWATCEECVTTFRAFMMPAKKAKCCPNCGRRLEWE